MYNDLLPNPLPLVRKLFCRDMAQANTQPISAGALSKPGTNNTANGHYVNGSTSTSDASTERVQIINDEKEFT